jgi:putative multiple sugar transport system ATP-binding protein
MSDTILNVVNIEKKFHGVKALDNVNLRVRANTIHAIVGENGAGKSTLMNILSGVYSYQTYSGEIYFDNALQQFKSIHDLSIVENIFMGHEIQKFGVIDWKKSKQEAKRLLEVVGLNEDVDTLVKYLGVGKQQLVEIAKALSKSVKLLIMDEPTAALNDNDSDKLLDLIVKLKKEQNLTVLIISHKLDEIIKISDDITVLRDGKTIETFPNDEHVTKNRIIKSMVGREMDNLYPSRVQVKGKEALRVKNWTVYSPTVPGKKVIDNVNFQISYGEIVGIAGLMGAGRTELALSLFGKAYGTSISGEIYKDNRKLELRNIHDAIKNGIAYVTEDRKESGLILIEDIVKNISLPNLDKFSDKGILNEHDEINAAKELCKTVRVKASSVFQKTQSLSGGNQQKVMIARWICNDPDILILDEPTRGIDVGAKFEIYSLINQLAENNKAILVISSELPEILGICDRIYIMNEGRFVGELDKNEATQEKIMNIIVHNEGGSQNVNEE